MREQQELTPEAATGLRRISLILTILALALTAYLVFVLLLCPLYIYPSVVMYLSGADPGLPGRIGVGLTLWTRTSLGMPVHLGLLPAFLLGAAAVAISSWRRADTEPVRMLERQVWLIAILLLASAAGTAWALLGMGWPLLLRAIGMG